MHLSARLLCFPLLAGFTALAGYDPLSVPAGDPKPAVPFTVKDAARNREIPVKVYLPARTNAAPVVLFSHGLGGSRDNNPYLGNHWAGRGYVVVFLQHAGSDESVWKNTKRAGRMQALKGAADAKNYLLRVKDVPVVIDQLAAWNRDPSHLLRGRLDLDHLGMSGHSFGALTTQAVSGQKPARGTFSFTDPRIDAAVMFSPSVPAGRVDAATSFGSVAIPWLLMTGTHDVSVIGSATVESRLAVFPALPAGNKYQVVLDQAEHSAFSERSLPGDRMDRNPNHHRVILAVSTAFWDAFLRDDPDAKKWLEGDGPRGVLEQKDQWMKK